jgi:hypothetical protein
MIYVANGGVVVVHSGDARMTLFSSGEVDICGPAKFTVLTSGDAITLALNFGRLHVKLPAKTALRIFTPTIIATPIDISGGARDVTVGLNLDDSLCVVAAGGALQLEHQFSGEKLIVPQAGEFFLDAGRLLPVAGKAGSCVCAAMQPRPLGPPLAAPLDYAANVAPLTAPQAPAADAKGTQPQPPAEEKPEAEPSVQFSIAANANEAHPVEPAKNTAPGAPPSTVPVYTVVAPPLSFMASSPEPPPDPEPDTVLLVREAQVSPEWEFAGHVVPPTFAGAMRHALGEGPSPQGALDGSPGERKGGFWAALKSILVGRGGAE